jgi:1-phosphofructokinase family hexose kinase
MILTVTPNTALDRVMFIDEWTPGIPMRTAETLISAGGKGLVVCVALRHLGVDSLGLAFVAGHAGRTLADRLAEYGVQTDLVWADGETRISHIIVERKYHRHNHLVAGEMDIQPQHVEQFMTRLRLHLPQADYVICAGSMPRALPDDFYRTIVDEAARYNKPVLVDTSRGPMRALLDNPPAIVKMNEEELNGTFETNVESLPDLIALSKQVYAQYHMETLIVTCGERGLLAFTREGAYHAVAPLQAAVSAAGAGDATSAVIVWRRLQGDSWPEALRWAAAGGAAAVLTPGTGECHLADVLRLRPLVRLEAI